MSNWNGLPDQPERSGWHWLAHKQFPFPQPFEWDEDEREWGVDDDHGSPEEMVAYGYEYICPCPAPSELAQMRKDERERSIAAVCNQKMTVALGKSRDAFNLGIRTAIAAIRALTDDEGKKS